MANTYCQKICPQCKNQSLCESEVLQETFCIRCEYMFRWEEKPQSDFAKALLADLPIMEYYEQKYDMRADDY